MLRFALLWCAAAMASGVFGDREDEGVPLMDSASAPPSSLSALRIFHSMIGWATQERGGRTGGRWTPPPAQTMRLLERSARFEAERGSERLRALRGAPPLTRRFHVVGIGMAKTGTATLASMLGAAPPDVHTGGEIIPPVLRPSSATASARPGCVPVVGQVAASWAAVSPNHCPYRAAHEPDRFGVTLKLLQMVTLLQHRRHSGGKKVAKDEDEDEEEEEEEGSSGGGGLREAAAFAQLVRFVRQRDASMGQLEADIAPVNILLAPALKAAFPSTLKLLLTLRDPIAQADSFVRYAWITTNSNPGRALLWRHVNVPLWSTLIGPQQDRHEPPRPPEEGALRAAYPETWPLGQFFQGYCRSLTAAHALMPPQRLLVLRTDHLSRNDTAPRLAAYLGVPISTVARAPPPGSAASHATAQTPHAHPLDLLPHGYLDRLLASVLARPGNEECNRLLHQHFPEAWARNYSAWKRHVLSSTLPPGTAAITRDERDPDPNRQWQ